MWKYLEIENKIMFFGKVNIFGNVLKKICCRIEHFGNIFQG